MEISSTILQGLANVISGNPSQPEQSESTQIHGSPQIFQNSLEERVNGTSVHSSVTDVSQTGNNSQVLSVGEREILALLFGEQQELEGSIYQAQTSKPFALGNFVDLRG